MSRLFSIIIVMLITSILSACGGEGSAPLSGGGVITSKKRLNIKVSSSETYVGGKVIISSYLQSDRHSNLDVSKYTVFSLVCQSGKNKGCDNSSLIKREGESIYFAPKDSGVYKIKATYEDMTELVDFLVEDVNTIDLISSVSSTLFINKSERFDIISRLDNGNSTIINFSELDLTYDDETIKIDLEKGLVVGLKSSDETEVLVRYTDYKGKTISKTFYFEVRNEIKNISIETIPSVAGIDQMVNIECDIEFDDSRSDNCGLLNFSPVKGLHFDEETYTVSASSPGIYEVEAAADGHQSATRLNVVSEPVINYIQVAIWPDVTLVGARFEPRFTLRYNDGSAKYDVTMTDSELKGSFELSDGLEKSGDVITALDEGVKTLTFTPLNTHFDTRVLRLSPENVKITGLKGPSKVIAGDQIDLELVGYLDNSTSDLNSLTQPEDWTVKQGRAVNESQPGRFTVPIDFNEGEIIIEVNFGGKTYRKQVEVISIDDVRSLSIKIENQIGQDSTMLAFGQSNTIIMSAVLNDNSKIMINRGSFEVENEDIVDVDNYGLVIGRLKNGVSTVRLIHGNLKSNFLTFNVIDEEVDRIEFVPQNHTIGPGEYFYPELRLYTINGSVVKVNNYILKFKSGQELFNRVGIGYVSNGFGIAEAETYYAGRVANLTVNVRDFNKKVAYISDDGEFSENGYMSILPFSDKIAEKTLKAHFYDNIMNEYKDLSSHPDTIWKAQLIKGTEADYAIENGIFSTYKSAIGNIYKITATNLYREAVFTLTILESKIESIEFFRTDDEGNQVIVSNLILPQNGIYSNLEARAILSDGSHIDDLFEYFDSVETSDDVNGETRQLPRFVRKKVDGDLSELRVKRNEKYLTVVSGNTLGNISNKLSFKMGSHVVNANFDIIVKPGLVIAWPNKRGQLQAERLKEHVQSDFPYAYFVTQEIDKGGFTGHYCEAQVNELNKFDSDFELGDLIDNIDVLHAFAHGDDTLGIISGDKVSGDGFVPWQFNENKPRHRLYLKAPAMLGLFPNGKVKINAIDTYKGKVTYSSSVFKATTYWVDAAKPSGKSPVFTRDDNYYEIRDSLTRFTGICSADWKRTIPYFYYQITD